MNSDFWRSRRLVDAEMATNHIRDKEEYREYAENILNTNTPVTGGVFAMWETEKLDAAVLFLHMDREAYDREAYVAYAKALLGRMRLGREDLYIGAALSADIRLAEENVDQWISFFAELVQVLEATGYDFLYIMDGENVENARCAVLAAKEVSSMPVLVSLHCDEDGHVGDMELLAALSIFEGLGVTAFGLSSDAGPEVVATLLGELYPFAGVPLFTKLDGSVGEDWEVDTRLSPGLFGTHVRSMLENGATHIFLGSDTHEEYLEMARLELGSTENVCTIPKEERLIATCMQDAYFLDPCGEISRPVYVTEDFAEDVLAMEEENYQALKVHFQSADDFELFVENMYMLHLPLCISADNLALYERGAMLYTGRAVYDGTLEFEDDPAFRDILRKYGVIAL